MHKTQNLWNPTREVRNVYFGELTHGNIRKIFEGAGDFMARELYCGAFSLYAYAIDGLTSGADTSEYVIRPIAEKLRGETMEALFQQALGGSVYNSVAVPCKDLEDVANKLVNGFCVVLFPGMGAIAFEVKTGEKRGISGPEVENTVKGPKDAFVETVRTNTSLVRRHLRSPDLRLWETQVGRRSLTNVTVVSIEGITNPQLISRMRKRLEHVDVDGFLMPSAVEEYVTGSRKTAFPLIQYTERADKFCAGLLEGRVGLLVDGLPLGYLAPADLGYLMESPEDWSRDYLSASCLRVLRYSALVLSLLLPGVAIALGAYHQEMIPLPLLRTIIESKKQVPFSATAEVLGLLVAFELLQESGIHLPQAVGQSVSTIGGIVVGTAAVDAGLVSPGALIVVSIAGVCGFALPNRDLAEAVRLWRFGLSLMAAVGGLLGISVGICILVGHLAGLQCLEVPYLAPFHAGGSCILRNRMVEEKYRDPLLHPEDGRKQK